LIFLQPVKEDPKLATSYHLKLLSQEGRPT
jgi:hypothetical protein